MGSLKEEEPLLSSSDPEWSVAGDVKPPVYKPGMYGKDWERIHSKVTKKTTSRERVRSNLLSQITEETTSSSTESEIEAAKETVKLPLTDVNIENNILLSAAVLNKDLSSTSSSSSSTSEYEATYEQKPGKTDLVDIEAGGKSNYEYNQYKLNDCNLVNTSGLSYSQVVEEHLHRNPSLETSKSSVELERAMRPENNIRDEKIETAPQKNMTARTTEDRTNINDKRTSHLSQDQHQRENIPSLTTNDDLDEHGDLGDAGHRLPSTQFPNGTIPNDTTVNRWSHDTNIISSMTSTSHFKTTEDRQVITEHWQHQQQNSNEKWQHQHQQQGTTEHWQHQQQNTTEHWQHQQQGRQAQIQTNGNVTTSTTTSFQNSQSKRQLHSNDDSSASLSTSRYNSNVNGRPTIMRPEEGEGRPEEGEGRSEEHNEVIMATAATVGGKVQDNINFVMSAKEKEKEKLNSGKEKENTNITEEKEILSSAPAIRTSEVPGYFNYNQFLSGVEDSKTSARREQMVDMTSTPRESVRVKADSTSSSMSNEEIVRSHLKTFGTVKILNYS